MQLKTLFQILSWSRNDQLVQPKKTTVNMKKCSKLLTINIIALQIIMQLSSQTIERTNNISPEEDLVESKRYQLFEKIYTNLNRIAWSQEVYNEISSYLNDLKGWSSNQSALFRKLNVYQDFQSTIDSNINLLNALKLDPDNCGKQINFTMQHNRMKMFQHILVENEEVLREWMQKDRILLRKLLFLTIRSYKKFYAKLEIEVENYLNNLEATIDRPQEEGLREWHEAFVRETDFVEKQFLITDFMALFEKEKNLVELKCHQMV